MLTAQRPPPQPPRDKTPPSPHTQRYPYLERELGQQAAMAAGRGACCCGSRSISGAWLDTQSHQHARCGEHQRAAGRAPCHSHYSQHAPGAVCRPLSNQAALPAGAAGEGSSDEALSRPAGCAHAGLGATAAGPPADTARMIPHSPPPPLRRALTHPAGTELRSCRPAAGGGCQGSMTRTRRRPACCRRRHHRAQGVQSCRSGA